MICAYFVINTNDQNDEEYYYSKLSGNLKIPFSKFGMQRVM